MMRRIYLLLISILVFSFLTSCKKAVFDGSRTSNEKQFIMSYRVLNMTKTHEMSLLSGAKIDVEIVNESGQLDIYVTDSKGQPIYVGNDAISGTFTLEIQNSDIYLFKVTGKDAKGSVSFIVVD